MQWTRVVNDHKMLVSEATTDDPKAPYGLVVYCESCFLNLGMLDSHSFPKFRIAFKSAWKRADAHATHAPWTRQNS